MSLRKIVRIIVLVLFVSIFISSSVYLNDYYKAEVFVYSFLNARSETVNVETTKTGYFFDGPGDETALIFYPGAKVEYIAYVPLLYNLSLNGLDCFLVEMPKNMAFLGINKADSIIENYEYDNWIMCGHSLGGVAASSYTYNHSDVIDGLVLLASYSTKQISDNIGVLTIYGSEDKVLNIEKMTEASQNLPADSTLVCIEGGNHGQFGSYGFQDGDGEPSITSYKQLDTTAYNILKLTKDIELKGE